MQWWCLTMFHCEGRPGRRGSGISSPLCCAAEVKGRLYAVSGGSLWWLHGSGAWPWGFPLGSTALCVRRCVCVHTCVRAHASQTHTPLALTDWRSCKMTNHTSFFDTTIQKWKWLHLMSGQVVNFKVKFCSLNSLNHVIKYKCSITFLHKIFGPYNFALFHHDSW